MITKLSARGGTGAFPKTGWAETMSLPLVLTEKDAFLQMEPVPELLEKLRSDYRQLKRVAAPAGKSVALAGMAGDVLELKVLIDLGTAATVGVKVRCSQDGKKQTVIRFDRAKEMLSIGDNWQPLCLGKNESLELRVFLDRSVLEVIGNKTAYLLQYIDPPPAPEDVRVECFADGGDAVVSQADAWKMGNLEYAPWAMNAPTSKPTKEGAAQ